METATLLIVDDEPFLLAVLSSGLKGFGANILTASNGQEALDIIKSKQIDAVLTDLDMPVMSGLELLAAMREGGYQTPVVILTGHGDQASTLTALRLGAMDFLDKPFESQLLREIMTKALGSKLKPQTPAPAAKPAVSDANQVSADQLRALKNKKPS